MSSFKSSDPVPYPDTQLYIDGIWRAAASGQTLPVENPATQEVIGVAAHAGIVDLDEALEAADRAFKTWRNTPATERSAVLRRAAALLRKRAQGIGAVLTQEQGKPLAQGR